MNDDIVARIEANPKYHELVRKRLSYSIVMSILMIIAYYGYILLIAFNKEWLGTPVAPGMVMWSNQALICDDRPKLIRADPMTMTSCGLLMSELLARHEPNEQVVLSRGSQHKN